MRRGRLLVAGALCLPVLALSACQSTEQPLGAPSASPPQTLIKPHATKPSKAPNQKMVHSVVTGGAHGSAARAKLDAVVAQGQLALDSMLTDAMKKVYSDVRIEADYPSGVTYLYTFRNTVPAGTAQGLEAQSSQFEGLFTNTLAPALEMQGLTHTSATFTFKNPDGSVIWSHTYGG